MHTDVASNDECFKFEGLWISLVGRVTDIFWCPLRGVTWLIRGLVACCLFTQACASPSTHHDTRVRQTSALHRLHPAGRRTRDIEINVLNVFHFTFKIKHSVTEFS